MDRTQRKKYLFRVWAEVLIAGFAYFLVITFTSLRIPCIFYLLTGYQCPGCGVTRMANALIHMDLKGAFAYNSYVLCILPFLIPYGIYRSRKYIDGTGDHYSPPEIAVLVLLLIGALLFGVIRNLPS